ncbi:MAG: hypothetical protein ABSA42_14125 [Terracidiphilus sp.]|jgi:hypothetical protein
MAELQATRPVRGTQLLVEHMGDVLRRPSLIAIEVAWRWLFGIPFLLICWQQAQQILAAYPVDSSAFASLDTQNPWVAAVQISDGISFYEPHVLAVLRWLLPAAAALWIVVSGLGRGLLLQRMDGPMRSRPFTMMVLEGAWLGLFALGVWGWLRSMQWVAATHINVVGEPDLVGYFIWVIFLSLGFFTAFALSSWPLLVAPLLVLRENRSIASALRESLRLGKPFTGKLIEINLVLGIVKLALIVVAMVFSAAPLPFSDELGEGAMHVVAAASVVFYFVANDFFQVVRLKAFLSFLKVFRGPELT